MDNEEVDPASQVVVDELDRTRWTTLSKSPLELDRRFLRFALCAWRPVYLRTFARVGRTFAWQLRINRHAWHILTGTSFSRIKQHHASYILIISYSLRPEIVVAMIFVPANLSQL